MKQRILTLLLITGIFFTSCQKSAVVPEQQTPASGKTITPSSILNKGVNAVVTDPALNNVHGYIRLELFKDSVNNDNILIQFNPAAKTAYVPGEDAPTFQGFGLVSLSSFSSNNVPLAINAMPLTQAGLTINLKVNAKSDGIYKLNMTSIDSVPASYDIWLKDGYKKDSLDLRQNLSYAFNIFTADANSFGSGRFKVVIRQK